MTRPLLVVGAGGLGRETVAAARASNERRAQWEVIGFVDDDPELFGRVIDGVTVLGPPESIAQHPDSQVVVALGSPRDISARALMVARLALPPERYATVVHPGATLARGTTVGAGTVVLTNVATTVPLALGAQVVVMPTSVLTHDVVVEDHVTLASGVRIGGRARLRTGAYLGAGTSVREDCTIGEWSLVGMGATVIDDVPSGEVWVGVPARFLRRVDPTTDAAETSGRSRE